MPIVEIKIRKKDLSIELDAQGYQGSICLIDLDRICDVLKAKIIDKRDKKEMYSNIQIVGGVRHGR